MKLQPIQLPFPLFCFALAGLAFSVSGCQIADGISLATERISETRLVSRMTGKAKRDEKVIQQYQEMLGQKKQLAKNQPANKSANNEIAKETPKPSQTTASAKQLIQQASFETQGKTNGMASAHAALMQKNYPEAARLYKDILKKDPSNQMIHHRMAIISDEMKDFNAAEFHYRTALLSKPNDPNLLSDLGYSYLLQGKYGNSEEFLKKAIMNDPSHVRAMDNLGYLYAKQSRFDLAMNYFRKTGSVIEAQRKLNKVKTELGAQALKQPQLLNQQYQQTNSNQNMVSEIPPAPLQYQQDFQPQHQPQQIPAPGLQAPNPNGATHYSPQTANSLNQAPLYQNQPNQTQQNQTGHNYSVQQIKPDTGTMPNTFAQKPSPGTIPNTLGQKQTIEQYQGGTRIQSWQVNPVEPGRTLPGSVPTMTPGQSDHNLSPEETWPPANFQVPQNSPPSSAVKTTTYQQQSPQKMNQAIYSYPQGQKPNNVSNIPTHYQSQSLKPIQKTAAVMGMNAGPGGMFPVMQQRNLNTTTSGTQQPAQPNQVHQGFNHLQNQVPPNPMNQNSAWPQSGSPQNFQNGNQQFQPQQFQPQQNQPQQNQRYQNSQFNSGITNPQSGTLQQSQNQYSTTQPGTEISSGHHLMNQSPIQIFEQQYFEEMEKARTSQKQLPEGTKTWVQP